MSPIKPDAPICRSEEIELKLALPTSDPSSLAERLGRTPVLAHRKAIQQRLHNVYYDTPDQWLYQQRIALRSRRVGGDGRPKWLQTLKTAGRSDSALSQRGEWEESVPDAQLSLDALKATPWMALDPDGSVFRALVPAFVTIFERTSWMVRRRDRSLIEVSLDVGSIVAGDQSAPICELELELLAGQPAALFDLARQIAGTIAVLPAHRSKAERGYALMQNCLDMPLVATTPEFTRDLTPHEAAARVLREMYCQFTGNLNAIRTSDSPEVVHQARVAWRRFRSAVRLFKPVLVPDAVPSLQGLQPLLGFLSELRDIDVALNDTLPPLAEAFAAGDAGRIRGWQAMMRLLQDAADIQRKSVRYALLDPAVGTALLALTQWLENLPKQSREQGAGLAVKLSLRRWARRRIARLHEQLKDARRDTGNANSQHRIRIFAKRLRYSIEALRTLLPKRRTQHWYEQATDLQTSLGALRDVMQASALVAKLEADRGVIEFLRGIAVGQAKMPVG